VPGLRNPTHHCCGCRAGQAHQSDFESSAGSSLHDAPGIRSAFDQQTSNFLTRVITPDDADDAYSRPKAAIAATPQPPKPHSPLIVQHRTGASGESARHSRTCTDRASDASTPPAARELSTISISRVDIAAIVREAGFQSLGPSTPFRLVIPAGRHRSTPRPIARERAAMRIRIACRAGRACRICR